MNKPTKIDHFSRKELGDFGEKLAASYLRSEGAKVLFRNYKASKGGEVDLVVRDHQVLAFIEVKTRQKGTRIAAHEAVNFKKRQLIRRGGKAYLELLASTVSPPFRYDIIEVYVRHEEIPQIRWLKDAFGERENR